MKYCFGIDLGTTTTAISKVVESNNDPELLELIDDLKTVDTVVQFVRDSEEIACVGKDAWENLQKNFELTAFDFKPEIGKSGRFGHLPYSADTIGEKFLAYLRERLERQLGGKKLSELSREHDLRIFIGHPIGWESEQREAVVRMAERAGFPNATACAEPLGAILFHYHRNDLKLYENRYMLVYDFGGGTTDVAIMRNRKDDIPEIIAFASKPVGGRDFDARIEFYFKSEILRYLGEKSDIRIEDLASIRLAAREIKEKLSGTIRDGKDCCEKIIPFLYCMNESYTLRLARKDFENIHHDLISQASEPLEEAIDRAGLCSNDIAHVIVTGGSGRFYFVQEMLKRHFPESDIVQSINPQETVSKGLALSARPRGVSSPPSSASDPQNRLVPDKWQEESQSGKSQKKSRDTGSRRLLHSFKLLCGAVGFVAIVLIVLIVLLLSLGGPKGTASAGFSVSAKLDKAGWWCLGLCSDEVILHNDSTQDLTQVWVRIRGHNGKELAEDSFKRIPAANEVEVKIPSCDEKAGIDAVVKCDQGSLTVPVQNPLN